MQFLVEIPDTLIRRAQEQAVNRQMIAKFIREELQSCGGQFTGNPLDPDDWRQFITLKVKVKALNQPGLPPLFKYNP